MQDGDLPSVLESFSGHYPRLLLATSPDLTILSADSFPGLSFDYVFLTNMVNLVTIESGFLQDGNTFQIQIDYCSKLRFDIEKMIS